MNGNAWNFLVVSLGKDLRELGERDVLKERKLLEKFAITNERKYSFSDDPQSLDTVFSPMFNGMVEHRFKSPAWAAAMCHEHRYLCLVCVRLMSRDAHFQHLVVSRGVLTAIRDPMTALAHHYMAVTDEKLVRETLVEYSAVSRRIINRTRAFTELREARVIAPLLHLVGCSDYTLLPQVLTALEGFAAHDIFLPDLFTPEVMEKLMHILVNYQTDFKQLVLRLLVNGCRSAEVRQVLLASGVASTVIGMLGTVAPEILMLLLNLVRKLTEEPDATQQMAQMGAIPMLVAVASSQLPPDPSAPLTSTQAVNVQLICSSLRMMAEDPESAFQIRAANGVYVLGKLLLRRSENVSEEQEVYMRTYLLRVLRFIFSVERNRAIFKRLFPPDLYAQFIDIGNYEHDHFKYLKLWNRISALSQTQRASISQALDDINREQGLQTKRVKDYLILELLGKGSFGSVYRARNSADQFVALKELPFKQDQLFGETESQRQSGCRRVASEVAILSSLEHPNIVRYYDSFELNDCMYLVMELVEGESLQDHLNTLAEKRKLRADACMAESDIWQVVGQLLQALYYIHEEKGVVHRDLSPANVVLARGARGNLQVKLADFGLAKQQQDNALLQSMVGTMTYTCPEIVTNKTYNAKADIWSLGCIMYQMMMGHAPFDGSNPFTIAQQIVEGNFTRPHDPPPPAKPYSKLLKEAIVRMLTPDPTLRPTAAQVAAMVAPVLLSQLDAASTINQSLMRALEGRELQSPSPLPSPVPLRRRDLPGRKASHLLSDDSGLPRTETPPFARHLISQPFSASRPLSGASSKPGSPVSPRATEFSVARPVKVAASKLKLIADPCSQLLAQVHRLVWLSLQPTAAGAAAEKQHAVARFCTKLFGPHSLAVAMKGQLTKLANALPEEVQLPEVNGSSPAGVTYKQLHDFVEELAALHGYQAAQSP